mgnify:FL=1
MIAISTAWIPEDGWPIEKVFTALDVLEPEAIELNYRVHPLDIEEVRRQAEQRGIAITSLHNICSTNPNALRHDDRYGDMIASLDENIRRLGVRYLRETAETARALGARAVVIHSGSVEALKQSPIYSQSMKRATQANDPSIVAAHLPGLVRERARLAPRHFNQLISSLREVCPDFPDLRFGLEIRYHYYSLPDFDELDMIFREVGCANLGYWHDCGHGQVQQNLGIRRHEDWLKRYQDRLVGVHLHGMENLLLDHQAPRQDNMDFAMISRYVGADTLLVIEASPSNSAADMLAGKKYLETVFRNGQGAGK